MRYEINLQVLQHPTVLLHPPSCSGFLALRLMPILFIAKENEATWMRDPLLNPPAPLELNLANYPVSIYFHSFLNIALYMYMIKEILDFEKNNNKMVRQTLPCLDSALSNPVLAHGLSLCQSHVI